METSARIASRSGGRGVAVFFLAGLAHTAPARRMIADRQNMSFFIVFRFLVFPGGRDAGVVTGHNRVCRRQAAGALAMSPSRLRAMSDAVMIAGRPAATPQRLRVR